MFGGIGAEHLFSIEQRNTLQRDRRMTDDEFTTIFTDKEGRTIVIRVQGDPNGIVSASHDGTQIGSIEIWETEEGEPLLKFSDVDEGYQNAGIGKELLRRAFAYYGKMWAPNPNPSGNDNPMTTAGISCCHRLSPCDRTSGRRRVLK